MAKYYQNMLQNSRNCSIKKIRRGEHTMHRAPPSKYVALAQLALVLVLVGT